MRASTKLGVYQVSAVAFRHIARIRKAAVITPQVMV